MRLVEITSGSMRLGKADLGALEWGSSTKNSSPPMRAPAVMANPVDRPCAER